MTTTEKPLRQLLRSRIAFLKRTLKSMPYTPNDIIKVKKQFINMTNAFPVEDNYKHKIIDQIINL
jgi:hypothetical protein